jgi:hypothetical protein
MPNSRAEGDESSLKHFGHFVRSRLKGWSINCGVGIGGIMFSPFLQDHRHPLYRHIGIANDIYLHGTSRVFVVVLGY